MANLPALVVLTLLQLCRAEISETLPETWYSANVINDGFQPKSISEIFTTEASFSSTNPIIVLPKSSNSREIVLFSTVAPLPQVSSGSSTLTGVSNVSVTPLSPSTIPPTLPPARTEQTQRTTMVQAFETSSPATPIVPAEQRTTQVLQQSRESQSQVQQIRFEVAPLSQAQPVTVQSESQTLQTNPSTTNLPQPSAAREPLSNYFLIYQQAPQNIQSFAPPESFTGPGSRAPDSSSAPVAESNPVGPLNPVASQTTNTPIFISTTQTQITSTSLPPITSSLAPYSSYTLLPSSDRTISIPASVQTVAPSRITNTPTGNTLCPNPRQNVLAVTTPVPNLSLGGAPYPLRIRVVAPTGSITNVNINPATMKTTTTRRPTTTRAIRVTKPKRNSYDRCINSCKGNKDPICTIPLGSTPINPNTLKGFPSVCHMACHNSYRKDAYEKVLDGRCGRLRTRIQSVDSNSKLTRDELNKAQYTVEGSGPQTFIEFSGTLR